MNEESESTLDPRKQTLVAALYGELSAEEDAAFHRMLSEDASLRAEWEELKETRVLLEGWTPEETSPGFLLLDHAAPRRPGFMSRIRRAMTPPAWGFAGAALAMAALLLLGLRVDRVENGFAVRFGSDKAPVETASSREDAASFRDAGSAPVRLIPVSAETELLTRDDMEARDVRLMRALEARLSQYREMQHGEMAYVLQSFYDEILDKQLRDYGLLQNQIQGVELGLAERSRTSSLPDSLLDTPGGKPDDNAPREDEPR